MKKLFETIKVEDGQLLNIEWHNRRFNKSRLELFNIEEEIDLKEYITNIPQNGLYRCRVLYSQEIESILFFTYTPKKFTSFKIIKSSLSYNYKFDDRSEINTLKDDSFDEIIIEKEGLLTDTSIANIAFFDGKRWITPKKPLLEGTTRARLLHKGFLTLKNIKKEHIKNYSHFALMNAMIGFQIQKSVIRENIECL